jgi:hypothetical protein
MKKSEVGAATPSNPILGDDLDSRYAAILYNSFYRRQEGRI